MTLLHMYIVSKTKSANLFFALWSNMNEPISIMSWKKHLTKLCKKCPRHLKYSTTLENLKWQIESSTQYLHVHFEESLNSNKHKWHLLSQIYRQTCSKSHHPYIISSKSLPPAGTHACRRRWRHVANRTFNEQRDSDCSLVLDASS